MRLDQLEEKEQNYFAWILPKGFELAGLMELRWAAGQTSLVVLGKLQEENTC